MTITTTLKSAIAAAALTLAVAAQAEAESTFGTPAGIDAEPMNAQEMDAVQGKDFYYDGLLNLLDVNRVVYTFDWSCLECGLSYYRFIDPTGDQGVSPSFRRDRAAGQRPHGAGRRGPACG